MSFNQIVWKMAKVHYKKYIFYFLCNCFAIMLFFMFLTVYLNERVIEVKKSESIQYVLTIPGVALIVFTVFFISYAHSIFIKRRKSEFGLFITLGMSNRDICKLVIVENVVIAFFSIIFGILAGAVFSRLFFLILLSSVGLQTVPFQMNRNMFLYAVLIFLGVSSVAVGKSLIQIITGSVVQSLKSDQIAESIKQKNPMVGAFGFIIVIGSIIGLYFTYSDPIVGGQYLLLWTMATFIGLYLCFSQFTSFFLKFAKKSKRYYYRRLLLLTNLDYKIKQLTSILMLVTVMIMVTILYSTIILFSYISTEKEVIEQNPFDIAFLQTEHKNNLGKKTLNSIFTNNDNQIQQHLIIPTYYYYEKRLTDTKAYPFIAVDDFNRFTSKKITLKDTEYLHVINTTEDNEDRRADELISINNEKIRYKLQETIVGNYFNNLIDLHEVFVLNKSELTRLKSQLNGFETNIHLINVSNWKNSMASVEQLIQELKAYNIKTTAMNDVRVEELSEDDYSRVESKIEAYNRNKHTNGISFFVTSILSIIFFIGSFTLLYLNLFADFEKEKEKFKKLHNIGITNKEMKRIITREITALFFIPTIIGTVLALLYIIAMVKDIGGVMKNPEILLHFLIVSAIYGCVQIIFFFYARRKMFIRLVEK